jgi:hypothetical protein
MKVKKLLKKLKRYINADTEEQMHKEEGLSKVLKKLKKNEQKLQKRLEKEKDKEERELIEQELEIVHSQRKKGIKLLSDLRKKERE